MIIGANDAPVVLDPSLSLPAQTVTDSMTINPLDLGDVFGDEDGTPLTFSSSSLPPGLSIDPVTGVVSGTLTSGASQGGDGGVYTAIITATDPEGVSASTSIEYTVTNLAPTSQDDSFTITEETPLSANILVNDTDIDGDILVIDAVALADGTVIAVGETVTVPEGMLTVAANGDISFVPAPDYFGTFVFGYTVTDNNGDTDMGSVTISVENVNDAPAIVDDGPVDVTEDTPVSGNVLTNDSDADGDPLTVGGFTVDGDPTAYGPGDTATIEGVGTIIIAGDGTYTFTPEPDYSGPVPDVTVTVTDPSGAVASSTLSFSDIENVNDAPVLTGIPLDVPTLIEGETIEPISVSEAFMDADDDPLTFSADGLPPGLSIDPETGIITGTLPGDAGVNSPYEVTIIAMDPSGAIQTLSVVITLENPAPIVDQPDRTGSGVDGSDGEILALDGGTHQAGLETEIDVAVFIDDPDNDALTYRAEGLPDGLSVDPETGVISGTPLVPTERPVAALLTVTDAQGGVLQFTLNLVVEGEVSTRPNYNETSLSERIVTESDPYAWVDTQPVNLRLWFAEHSLAVKGLEGIDLTHIGTDVEFRRGMAVSRASCYSDACSYLIVETLAYEHHINMQLGSTIALENDIDVRSWEVTQSDGSALPDWATHEAGADMVFIQRPLDQPCWIYRSELSSKMVVWSLLRPQLI